MRTHRIIHIDKGANVEQTRALLNTNENRERNTILVFQEPLGWTAVTSDGRMLTSCWPTSEQATKHLIDEILSMPGARAQGDHVMTFHLGVNHVAIVHLDRGGWFVRDVQTRPDGGERNVSTVCTTVDELVPKALHLIGVSVAAFGQRMGDLRDFTIAANVQRQRALKGADAETLRGRSGWSEAQLAVLVFLSGGHYRPNLTISHLLSDVERDALLDMGMVERSPEGLVITRDGEEYVHTLGFSNEAMPPRFAHLCEVMDHPTQWPEDAVYQLRLALRRYASPNPPATLILEKLFALGWTERRQDGTHGHTREGDLAYRSFTGSEETGPAYEERTPLTRADKLALATMCRDDFQPHPDFFVGLRADPRRLLAYKAISFTPFWGFEATDEGEQLALALGLIERLVATKTVVTDPI